MPRIFSRFVSSSGSALALVGLLWLPPMAAQASSITANDEFVFLERNGFLYQFDATDLELIRRVEISSAEKLLLAKVARAEKKGGAAEADSGPHDDKTEDLRAALSQGLAWLASHQDESGRWDADEFMKHDQAKVSGAGSATQDVGVTALAILTMLGDGNTQATGPYAGNVKRGLTWLRSQQRAEDGLIGSGAPHDFIYGHAIATWALSEALLLSGDESLRPSVTRAAGYLEAHRNPYMVWRYQPRDNDNDTSVTAWCTIALRAAKDAKVEVNKDAFLRVGYWLDQITDPNTGRHGYAQRGSSSSRMPGDHSVRFPVMEHETLTAAGLFCRFLIGQQPAETPIMAEAADRVLAKAPDWDPKAGKVDYTFWAFGSLAMYQMGERYWSRWSRHLTSALLGAQRKESGFNGSWDPCGPWGHSGGRVYSTALATFALQTAYRSRRLVRIK